ncbi:uncharacterized protein LOC141912255 isoform X2 [Tubulanus polymorphus]|uniref:uncharacterized protein LOC141912255 isoform X2 n=1 Tax=Tubulanus polymorphus TaxID=672921 RepID=UPI003DA30EA9
MWSCVTPADDHSPPCSRFRHAVCLHRGQIYLYGGRNGNQPLKDLWKYDIKTNTWNFLETRGDSPGYLEEHTLIAYKDNLCIFGGGFNYGGESDTPLWTLNLETLTWEIFKSTTGCVAPTNRRGHSAVIINGSMHIYGGYIDLKGSNSDMWTYNFGLVTWNLVYNMQYCSSGPGARHWHTAIAYDNCMWVHGGMMDLVPKNDLWKFCFDIQQWTKVKTKPNPPMLQGHIACQVNNGMLIFGGECAGSFHSDVWKYNFVTHTWQKLPVSKSSPGGRVRHAGVIVTPSDMLPDVGQSRSSSMPFLQNPELGIDDNNWELYSDFRPYSSPPSIYCDLNHQQVFHCRISPSLPKGVSLHETAYTWAEQSTNSSMAKVVGENRPLLQKKTDSTDSMELHFLSQSHDSDCGNENDAYEKSAGSVDLQETRYKRNENTIANEHHNDASNLMHFNDQNSSAYMTYDVKDEVLALYDPICYDTQKVVSVTTEKISNIESQALHSTHMNSGLGKHPPRHSFASISRHEINEIGTNSCVGSSGLINESADQSKLSNIPGLVLNGSLGSSEDSSPVIPKFTNISSPVVSPICLQRKQDLTIYDEEAESDVSEIDSLGSHVDQALLPGRCIEDMNQTDSDKSQCIDKSVTVGVLSDDHPLLMQSPKFSPKEKHELLHQQCQVLSGDDGLSHECISHLQLQCVNSREVLIQNDYLYLYVFGGKEKSTRDIGTKPMSVWKYTFKQIEKLHR